MGAEHKHPCPDKIWLLAGRLSSRADSVVVETSLVGGMGDVGYLRFRGISRRSSWHPPSSCNEGSLHGSTTARG